MDINSSFEATATYAQKGINSAYLSRFLLLARAVCSPCKNCP